MKAKKSNPTVVNVNCPTSAQTSIKMSLHSASVHPSRSQRYNEIINRVTLHLAKYVSNKQGFVKMVNLLDKRHDVPNMAILACMQNRAGK